MKDRKVILTLLLGVVGLYIMVLCCTELSYYARLPHRATGVHERVYRMLIGQTYIRYGSHDEYFFRKRLLDWIAVPAVLLCVAIVIGYKMAESNTAAPNRLSKWDESEE